MEIKDLTFEQLIQKETVGTLVPEINQLIKWQDAKECFRYVKYFNNISKNKSLPAPYDELLKKLKWICFSNITYTDAIELIENGFVIGLDLEAELDIDLLLKIKSHLISMSFYDQENFKLDISAILEKSKQIVTAKDINVNGRLIQATIENWLTDYRVNVINQNSNDKLLLKVEYLSSSKNIRVLSAKEKLMVQSLIEIYNFVNTSGLLPGGYVEDHVVQWEDGSIDLFSDGLIQRISGLPNRIIQKPFSDLPFVENTSSEVEKEIINAYQGDQLLNKKIKKELDKIQSKFKDEPGRLKAEFFAAVQKNNVARTVAILAALVQQDELENFIADDEKLNEFLISVWSKQFDASIVNEFRKDPKQLKFVKMFLRYIFEQRLGLGISEAARIGLQISNIFVSLGKKSYNKVAYFDVESKQFKWFD